MTPDEIQQAARDEALVSTNDRVKIVSCNMRIDPSLKQKEATYQFQLDNKNFKIGVELFHKIFSISPRVPNKEFVPPPPHDALVTFLKSLGYKGSLEFVVDLCFDNQEFKSCEACSIRRMLIMPSYFGKTSSTKLTTCKQVLGDMKACPILDLPKSSSITSFLNTNPFTRDTAYQTYLAISTGIIAPKKDRKGKKTIAIPKKKGLIIAEKITCDEGYDESNNEQKRMLIRRRSTGVIIRENSNVSKKKTLDETQKLKGIELLSDAVQLALDTQKVIKSNKRDIGTQQPSKGSSEGAGITLEVPDETKGKTAAQADDDDDWGSETESEKADDEEKAIDDKDINDCEIEWLLTDDEKKTDDDKVHEETHDDEEMQDDDEEKKVDDKSEDIDVGLCSCHTDIYTTGNTSEEKLAHLEQPLIPLPYPVASQAARDAYNTLLDAQNEVVCLMLGSMSSKLQRALKNYKAYDMIQELKTMFEEQAKQELLERVKAFHACYAIPNELGVSLILNSLNKDYDQFVQNYNMHSMGNTIGELHAMLKLHEKGIPKKAETPAVLAIREDKIQNNKRKPRRAKGKDKGNNKLAYAPKPKIPPPPKRDNPAKDFIYHHCKEGLIGSKKLKHGALSLYMGNGMRAAVEAIGNFDLILHSEYLSHEFVNHMKSCCIVSQLTPPYAPQHNGVSERRNQTLLDMFRSMMNLITLLKSFWGYALESAARILNMVPTKKVERTPYEIWHRKAPKLSYLRVWDCEALMKQDAPEKLDPRSIKCIFVGYPKETMGYYFYYPPENKIFVARNTEFFENNLIVQEASGSHGLLKISRSNEGLELIQEEDTQHSKNTSEEHNEVLPIEEHELGDRNEPPNYKATLSDTEYDKWLKAINTKMQSMKDKQVWILVKLPPNGQNVGSKWIFKKKTDMDGSVHTFKARLQASRSWNKRFDVKIKNIGFTQNPDEPCVYLKSSGSSVAFLILYVDDILLMGNNVTMLQEVKSWLYKDDTKSHTGYVFVLNDGAVDWKSAKQSTTAMSSKEAEYIVVVEASMEAVWMRKFIDGLGDVVPLNKRPMEMLCDNEPAIEIVADPGILKGARNFQRKYYYIREVIQEREIVLKKVHTDDNVADPFTKPMSYDKHYKHVMAIGIVPASSLM
ncbi:zinc finger, CCHC-type containing protein [Tanacetum coccineum]|uniref:Zinc finger, CCHC-type containing protein n=1 Tax=Tanacetum coccineum TaxID=301880 RepID=A0ABQ5DLL0_9ASTR